MRLWPHQEEAVRTCARAHSTARSRVLIQFPTGAGKTSAAVGAALEYLARPFSRVLIVVPSEPILDQFVLRLAECTRQRIAVEKARRRAAPNARLVVASQNSLWDRLASYSRDTLCIFDECHHSNFDASENLQIARSFDHLVGLSASPWSRGCEELFADAARVSLSLADAQRLGYVSPLSVDPWAEPMGPHAIVFCTTNAEAEACAAAHPGSTWIGVNSGNVEARIAAWRCKRHPVIYANRMLGEGFDEPACERVYLRVQSESDIRNYQMAGRALRARAGKTARIHCATPTVQQGVLRALRRAGWEPGLTP